MLNATGRNERRASFESAALCASVRQLVRPVLAIVALVLMMPIFAIAGADQKPDEAVTAQVREELWGIPSVIPMLAYMIRPVGDGPFPLLVMNHGVSLDQKERSYFPVIEFRDAALWFAKHACARPSGSADILLGFDAHCLSRISRRLLTDRIADTAPNLILQHN
jgi:hypothetical protein